MYTTTFLQDVKYGEVEGKDLLLDIVMPVIENKMDRLPVVIFLHGGGWETGDKSSRLGRGSCEMFAQQGFIGVSVNYRLTHETIFPGQIHDCKAAVRWLRENSDTYNINQEKIGVWGHSAGGHLSALLGTSANIDELEGDGGSPGFSSEVQAVVCSAPPTDLLQMGGWHNGKDSSESRLVGGALQERMDIARKANPISYIAEHTPPFMIIHGDEDEIVPFSQSELLFKALQNVTFIIVKGGDHDYAGGNLYWEEIVNFNIAFFRKHLIREPETKEELERRREEMRSTIEHFSRQ